jgi:hypothetical protein
MFPAFSMKAECWAQELCVSCFGKTHIWLINKDFWVISNFAD